MLRYIQGLTVAVLLGTAGCNVDNLLNQTASFGGDTAGGRSKFRYVIINNTPYRALFTAGAYDDLDQNTTPQFQQFGNDANGTHLEGQFDQRHLPAELRPRVRDRHAGARPGDSGQRRSRQL